MNEMAETSSAQGSCVVCGESDARLLVMIELEGGAAATLCGSHALLYGRSKDLCRTPDELRVVLSERRSVDRRAHVEGDELATRLSAAFTRDRRSSDRRAS